MSPSHAATCYIAAFTSRSLTCTEWELAAEPVRAAVRAALPPSKAGAATLISVLCRFLARQHGWQNGSELDLVPILTEQAITKYVAEVRLGSASSAKATRANLARLANAIAPKPIASTHQLPQSAELDDKFTIPVNALFAEVVNAAVQACRPVSNAHERVLRTHLRAYLAGPCGWNQTGTPDLRVLLTQEATSRYFATDPPGASSYLKRRKAALLEIARALGVQTHRSKRPKIRASRPSRTALLVTAPISVCALPAVIAARTGQRMGRGALQSAIEEVHSATAHSEEAGTVPLPATFRSLVEVPHQPAKDDTVTSHSDSPIRTRYTPSPAPKQSRKAVAAANKKARDNVAALDQGPVLSTDIPTLPAAMEPALKTYTPQVSKREVWSENFQLATRLVAGSAPKSIKVMLNNASHISAFLLWFATSPHRRDRYGTPIDAVELLAPDLADQFVSSTTWSSTTKNTARSTLRTTLNALNAHNARQTYPYRGAVPPYSPAQCDIIAETVTIQPTDTRSRDLSFIVALALGAGLSSADMRHLTPTHLEHHTDGAITVTVTAASTPRARQVPMRTKYVPLLLSALDLHTASGRTTSDLLLGKHPDRVNITTPAINRAEVAGLNKEFHVLVSRMRNTWLIAAMNAPISLADLLRVAGLKSARTVSDLLIYCAPPTAHDLKHALETAADISLHSAQTEVLS